MKPALHLLVLLVVFGRAAVAGTPTEGTLFYTVNFASRDVKSVSYSFDGLSKFTLGIPQPIAATPGADGILFHPDGELVVAGQADALFKIDLATGVFQTVNAGGTSAFHLSLDPSGKTIWSAGNPGMLAQISVEPFGDAIARFVTGDDTTITAIAFDSNKNAYYTSASSGGFGNFGRIDLSTFTTKRSYRGLASAHGILFDRFSEALILVGARRISQIDPANLNIVSEIDLTGSGLQFDQASADGKGHLFVTDNTGRLFFLDFSGTGLVGAASNFRAIPFLDGNLHGIAPLSGLGSPIPPCSFTCPSDIKVANDPGQCGAVVKYPDLAVVGSCLEIAFEPPSGSFFPAGTTSVLCTASDGAGNIVSCTFNVTVVDGEAPNIVCPAQVTVLKDANCQTVVPQINVSAWDNCTQPEELILTQVPPAGTVTSNDGMLIVIQATDKSGNTAACQTFLTVADKTPPEIGCLRDLTVPNDSGQCSAKVKFVVTATDNCSDAAVTISCDPPSGSEFPIGTTTVTCLATDKAGNRAECKFQVTVVDKEGPIARCEPTTNPAGQTNDANSGNVGDNEGFFQLIALDSCDANPALFVKDTKSDFVAGPFQSMDKIKLTQARGREPIQKKMAGEIVAQVILRGDAAVYAVDASGNKGPESICKLAAGPN